MQHAHSNLKSNMIRRAITSAGISNRAYTRLDVCYQPNLAVSRKLALSINQNSVQNQAHKL